MKKYVIILIAILSFFPLIIFASTTQGTIDPSHNLAWGENLAWINFSANNDVTVTDSALTGNIWSQTYGWINLNPAPYGGVANDGSGNLSGYAWGQNVGWINFSGAKIISGKFTGVIGDVSTTAGRITFDCASCDVETDWRPASARGPQGSGGGQLYPSTTTTTSSTSSEPTTTSTATVTPTTPPPTVSPTTPPATNTTSTTKFKFTKLLKLGSKGSEVKELQKVLNLKQDGSFGASTLKAVKAFQVKNKITKSGVAGYGQVGPKTREVLNQKFILSE
jgi:hypothetical protein